jgi:hypothetical protein
MKAPVDGIRDILDGQLNVAWKLLDLHLTGLTDEECLWRPAARGLHVLNDSGTWRAEWPETEAYATGPPSIAWLTWHIGFWWSTVLNHSFGDRTLRREDITWPGAAEATREWLTRLHDEWVAALAALPDHELRSAERTRWPFADKPFYQLAAWLNLELMKNAAEVGYCRFLYAVR